MNISFKTVAYWLSYAVYLYIIAPSALSKIIQRPAMMQSMQSLGFNTTWTVSIGIAETLGVLIVLLGLYAAACRTLGVLLLFPFAIGAFTTHMAHQEYQHFYSSLVLCLLSAVLLYLDKRIYIDLSKTLAPVK